MESSTVRIGVGGAAVVGVAFGMARYAYGFTLPDVREEFAVSELVLGMVAGGTFLGYLVGLLCVPWLSARRGPRAPTTVGAVCGVLGCTTVALAPSAGVLAAGAVLSGSAAGWVWAPYSDIVGEVVPPRRRATLLAVITTGSSIGLLGLAALGLLAVVGSWRWTWAGIALAAGVAAVLNLRTVPRLENGTGAAAADRASPWRRVMIAPLVHAVLYFAAITAYFTYATDVARSGELVGGASVLVYALIGAGGLAGLATGWMVRVLGAAQVACASTVAVGAALLLLGLGRTSLTLVLCSALVLGAGYMVGSSVLAIWTAEVVPDRPGDAFTQALVVGAVVSALTPVVLGASIPALGLPTVLTVVACCAVAGTVTLPLIAGPRRRVED